MRIMIRLINQGYEESEMFGVDLEAMLANNPTVLDFKRQFIAMQKTILDLEHRVEELERELKSK